MVIDNVHTISYVYILLLMPQIRLYFGQTGILIIISSRAPTGRNGTASDGRTLKAITYCG